MLIRMVNGWTTSTAHITYFRHRSELQRMCFLEYFRIKHPGNFYDEKNLVNLYETSLDDEWLPPYLKPVEEIPYRFVDKSAMHDLGGGSLSRTLFDAQSKLNEDKILILKLNLEIISKNTKNRRKALADKERQEQIQEVLSICDYILEFFKKNQFIDPKTKQEKIEGFEKVKELAEKLQSGKKLTNKEIKALNIK